MHFDLQYTRKRSAEKHRSKERKVSMLRFRRRKNLSFCYPLPGSYRLFAQPWEPTNVKGNRQESGRGRLADSGNAVASPRHGPLMATWPERRPGAIASAT